MILEILQLGFCKYTLAVNKSTYSDVESTFWKRPYTLILKKLGGLVKLKKIQKSEKNSGLIKPHLPTPPPLSNFKKKLET